jgi:perosamine synthetase
VIVVDQAGVPADVDSIRAALPPGVAVLEDAACGLGASLRGRPIGAGPWLVAFSFHPRKVITTGEGGMLMITDCAERVERARSLREHGVSVGAWLRHRDGHPSAERFSEIGFNLRMSDVAAAVGTVQLGKLDRIVARRRELAATYQRLLCDLPGLVVAHDPEHAEANYQSFWVLLPDDFPIDRDQLLGQMERSEIACRRGIMAAHLEPAFAQLPTGAGLPNTERLAARSMILPLFHEMTDDDQVAVANVIRRCAGISPVRAAELRRDLDVATVARGDARPHLRRRHRPREHGPHPQE